MKSSGLVCFRGNRSGLHGSEQTYNYVATLADQLLKTGTNLTTDREQFIRSNAPTGRLPTLVRLAETLRLTEHERATRNGDANIIN